MKHKRCLTFLSLEDGTSYSGWSYFNFNISIGEVVFNTGMTGYQEVMTDPSYYKQIVLFTYPEIGNTGVNLFDIESDVPTIKGLIAKNICSKPNNWRSSDSFIDYLIEYKIPHIFGIDTRFLTKKLRDNGVMLGCIASRIIAYSDINLCMQSFYSSSNTHFINNVTTNKIYRWSPLYSKWFNYIKPLKPLDYNYKLPIKVIVIDYGVKFNILNRLSIYGCNVTVVPATASYNSIIALNPDGILLSNGPGDPSLISPTILNIIQKLVLSNIPIFGICLGHQLLGLALGAKTIKMKFGHRGLNHPSGNYNLVKMTSQNHGYVVSNNQELSNIFNICYFNYNDKTVSGLIHKTKPCFSVQYHPESSPGPHDSDLLFYYFIKLILSNKN